MQKQQLATKTHLYFYNTDDPQTSCNTQSGSPQAPTSYLKPLIIAPRFEPQEDLGNIEEKELEELYHTHTSTIAREDIFELPETILCKRCGQYTADWITNDLCRECAVMLLEEAKTRASRSNVSD
ncbi:hypothetical protein [Desulfosediminicola flagellatus]|uniref:hypothetical protein n=1 Tax=Desulfosediminicola flagellatus TaxID=2569541 RepID=UPI0010AD6712|nr:hypothetical protein [Desulfosediminicola flagellatus]